MREKSKGGRPTKLTKDIKEHILRLAAMGYTDKQMAVFVGVTEQTLNNWKLAHQSFFESLKEAKAIFDSKVEENLFRLATGYRHTVQRPLVVSDGKDAGSHVEIVTYEERLPPNPTAMLFWLKNRRPQEWRDKQEVEHSGEASIKIAVEDTGL